MSANKVEVNKTVLSPMIGMFIFIRRCQESKYGKLLHDNLGQTSYMAFGRILREEQQQQLLNISAMHFSQKFATAAVGLVKSCKK